MYQRHPDDSAPAESEIAARVGRARLEAEAAVHEIEEIADRVRSEYADEASISAWRLRAAVQRHADAALIAETAGHAGAAHHHCLGAELRVTALESMRAALRQDPFQPQPPRPRRRR